MHYFLYPQKDTTIYEASSSLNSGMDEILEIRKNVSETGATIDVSRILMKFDLTWVSESIVSGLIENPKYYLNLYDANPKALAVSQSLEAAAISGSWDMGTGRSYDNPQTDDGASWNYRYSSTDATTWVNEMTASGAVWYASGSVPIASQSFNHKTTDMRMDVTGTVNAWLDGTAANDGFIIKRNSLQTASYHASSAEGTTDRLGSFSFFSSNTNTIYPPTLEVMWDDSKWNTGSLSALSSANLEDSVIYMKGLRPEYKEKSKARFRLVGRERFPEKTYSTTADNLSVKYLPSGSTFYSIVDAETEDVVVPFGTGSRVSCDSTGNYFNLWLDGYQPERYYSILYRVVSGSGTIEETDQYFDEGFTFKVSL